MAMKRNIMIFIILIFILTLSSGLTQAWAAEEINNVSIVGMKGKVDAMIGVASTWMPVSEGMKLGVGDTVRTGADSYVDLDFGGAGQAAVVRMGKDSSMKIDTYIASQNIENRKIILDLTIGDILVKVNKVKDESQFQVRTPTSVVGVRGTAFEVHVSLEK